MSQYQVLARKYRPKDFSELIGQNHVSHALANAIDTGRLHHAYLFTGTRGVGKTTIARILAKCLNCDTGITSTPCGTCDACTSIDSGRFIDLIEIDAASRTKVEDTRDLLENVPYAPTQGRYKVYLIDEVHMLSTHSFNALLKTLEEPPEHVKFILATTDPQKLPITIVSRCLQFVLRPLPQELLHAHLAHILTTEHISHTDNALWQLAQSAKGSVRDALSLTDQAIAFGGGALDDDTVASMLGLVDSIDVLMLIADIYADNRTAVAAHITRLRSQMVDAVAVLDRLVDTLHTLAMVQILPVPLDMNDAQKQALMALSAQIPSDVLQLYYEIAMKARDSVRLATTPMQALEMGLLRLLAFRPLASSEMPVCQPSVGQMPNTVPVTTPAQSIANHEHGTAVNQIDADQQSLNPKTTSHNTPNQENPPQESSAQNNFNQQNPIEADLSQKTTSQDSLADDMTDQIGHHQQGLNEQSPNQTTLNQEIPHQEIFDDKGSSQATLNQTTINHETLNQEIENQEIENQEIVGTNGSNLPMNAERFKQQLLAPKVELTGEWTPAKWDYWLSQARVTQQLDADELALANHAMMTGRIDGACTLLVSDINSQMTMSYAGLRAKFGKQFTGSQLDETLHLFDPAHQADKADVPAIRQQARQAQVLKIVQDQLLQSPVLQSLWQAGYIDEDGAAITSTKLLPS